MEKNASRIATKTWDIFCKVIDNYGDIGVCWRLCQQLAAEGATVRLIVDDASALAWMTDSQDGSAKIEIVLWDQIPHVLHPADVVIESFGCELPESYVAQMARQTMLGKTSQWINLEYLTAEDYAQKCHLLPSPVMQGVGKGLIKTFFYPGFSAHTGGLIREHNLPSRQAAFDRATWLLAQGIHWQATHSKGNGGNERIVSLFCYEPTALPAFIQALQTSDPPTLLLVTAGRAAQAVKLLQVPSSKALRIHYLPHLTQDNYDHLLWASDFNFVRGEDSLVRAIWAGKPFVWQIYPQEDDAHHAKLAAFLDAYLASTDERTAAHIRSAHDVWNEVSMTKPTSRMGIDSQAWQAASQAQSRLWAGLPDLMERLIAFVPHEIKS